MADDYPVPVAIIGMACRLPGGSDSPEKLWDMLSNGRSGWCEIPADRWNKDSFYHPDPEAKEALNQKGLYFLQQDIAAFDARFFGIHAYEAQCLDPQQRILMETTYEALENAGLRIQDIKGSDTSVHVGAYATDFERMGYKDLARVPKPHMIGSGIAILSNRLSYVFDLKGASSTVDTGCSGSMVALHQACQVLRGRESRMSIVAGTQLVLTPDQIMPMSMVGMTNPEGKCYVFDSRGSGYARGEGVVSFILKRLDDAIADNDNIHAIIRNSGLGQDGRTAGISLPNSAAQASLMKSVYKGAGLDPRETGYVEAHGTGTQAGDAAEIGSIAQVFCDNAERDSDIFVGSIKSNIGHLEASSGVAGLMKGILILKHGLIPPNIDFKEPKPSLHLDERKIKIAQEMTPLPSIGPKRVSVNSFGYGGTNAHIILEASPQRDFNISDTSRKSLPNGTFNGTVDGTTHGTANGNPNFTPNGKPNGTRNGTSDVTPNGVANGLTNGFSHVASKVANGLFKDTAHDIPNGIPNGIGAKHTENGTVTINGNGAHHLREHEIDSLVSDLDLFILSARSETSLRANIDNLQKWVSGQNLGVNMSDLSYTLSTRRTAMPFRYTTVARDSESLALALSQSSARITKSSQNVQVVFIFTGQGAQWFAMGKELIASQSVFKQSMERSDQILKELGSQWSLLTELSRDENRSRVGEAQIAQPSTTAIQLALIEYLSSCGVEPSIVLGHSSGEIGAAYAAGILDQRTALEISYQRGFMSEAVKRVLSSPGAMLAVGLGEVEVEAYVNQTTSGLVSIACVNSPSSTTISGDEAAIDELKDILDQQSIFARKLKIDTAYHSHHMKKVSHEYYESIRHVQSRPPKPSVRFFSSVTASEKTSDFNAQYWVDNLVSKVRFSNALDLICRQVLAVAPSGSDIPFNIVLEIGPHSALAGPVRQIFKSIELPKFKATYLPSIVRDKDGLASVLELAGRLFEFGYPISLDAAMAKTAKRNTHTPLSSLPPYAWDHSTSYFLESNLSKQHRFRAHPPHDLLGLRVPGTTVHEPTYRNIISVDSHPWLRDHVVDGFIIFPGTGYLCMAIEAARQISIDRKNTGVMSKIRLKNIVFSKPMIIPEQSPEGITPDLEIQLTLRPEKNLTDKTWDSFRVFSQSADDSWSEHCTGSVMVEWAAKNDETEGLREDELATADRLKTLQSIRDACSLEMTGEQLYKDLAGNGNVFGKTFSSVTQLRLGPHIGVSTVILPDITATMPSKFMQPNLIHPANFDAINHPSIPLFWRSCSNGPVMVQGMDEVTIDCQIGSKPGTKWIVLTKLTAEGPKSAALETILFQENEEDLSLTFVMRIGAAGLRSIGEAQSNDQSLPFYRKMSYKISWQPDIDFLPGIPLASKNVEHPLGGISVEDNAGPNIANYSQVAEYLKLLTFKHPHMNILEIGSGIGDATLPIMESLDHEEGALFDHYDFTDISEESFKEAKNLLSRWTNKLNFRALDISQDPIKQGFSEESYDLLIASDCLHTTESLAKAIMNTRLLLKPGGRLIILEHARPTGQISTEVGTFEVADGDVAFPSVSANVWDSTLKAHGFDGIEIAASCHRTPSMIVSQASYTRNTPQSAFPQVQIIITQQTESYQVFASSLITRLNEIGFSCFSQLTLPEAPDLESIYVVVDDIKQPLLLDPSVGLYHDIVSFLTTAKNVLWVDTQEDVSNVAAPVKGMVTGLARVVRRENDRMRFITVDLKQSIAEGPSQITKALAKILTMSFQSPKRATPSSETEYTISNSQIQIPRIVPDTKFEDWVNSAIYKQTVGNGAYHQEQRPLKLQVETPGILTSLRFVDDEVPSTELDPLGLEIEARAYGVNFKDVFIAMGQMIGGVNMVGECAGIVRRVGSAMQGRFSIGDRVCGVGAEPFCSRPRIPGNFAYKIPDSMSFATGASIPVIYATAYHSIVEVARLYRGQSILIHAASGGVGQAAIHLAQYIGATIFCTVGSVAKRQLLIDEYGIPSEHIFSSRLRTFKQGIRRLTNNKGVDCVLNSLAGEWLHDSLAVLAPLGTFVEIGKTDIYRKNQINMAPFDQNITFASVDLTVLGALRPEEMYLRLGKILSMFEEGKLSPVKPITTIPMTDIEEAFRLIQSRKHTGKVVLVCDPDTQVKLISARPKSLALRPDATYIIAGGLGDLGRRIARFMAARGAGHIVTLSRRKLVADEQHSLEEEIQSLGGQLHIVACDITNKNSVDQAASYCAAKLPPIKGAVHAGMVLRDGFFEKMSHDDYLTSLGPKVQGTQHLESAFGISDSMDFFIMFSSISSILGSTGQANYSVGNAYLDAFAQSKADAKCKYISLNLGAVDGSLAITSLSATQQDRMRQGAVLMSFDEVFKVLEYSMGSYARQDNLVQLVLGFDRKSMTTIHDTLALADPKFSRIPYLEAQETVKQEATTDVAKLLQSATTIEEVHDIVVHAICERFALFSARSIEDVSPSASPEEFGLDSLVAIELKNWLVRTFQVQVQTSEVVDAASISSLGKIIASRSKLVSAELGGMERAPGAINEGASTDIAERSLPPHNLHCCRLAAELPKLPLMDLTALFKTYLTNSSTFLTAEQFSSLSQSVECFQQPGATGYRLYEKLVRKANDPDVENWLDEFYSESIYLGRRYPLAPFSNFMGVHPNSNFKHTQAERAALITSLAFKGKQDLEADLWEPVVYMGTPNCTDLWQWLFNVARLPGTEQDTMAKFPANDYAVALHRGHAFRIDLKTGEENLSLHQLEDLFQSILDREDQSKSWLSILTADDRTSWARNREALMSYDKSNEETIKMIEAAAFMIYLDETSPLDSTARVRDMVMKEGFNRWNDKSLSFVVCKNGTSATYVEHTKIDGMTIGKIQMTICDAILTYDPSSTPKTNGHYANFGQIPRATKLTLTSTPTIDHRILEVRRRFIDDVSVYDFKDVVLQDFGKDYLLNRGMPIKGMFDLLVQLANYYYYGHNTPSWGTTSMSHFHKGRPDLVQVVTPAITAFCEFADDEGLTPEAKLDSMVVAANDHNKTVREALSGQCYQRTLRALELCVEEGGELPELFSNSLYESTVEPEFMVSNTDGTSSESCYLLSNPSKIWVTYYVTENGAHCSLVTGKDIVGKFEKCLHRASATMRKILDDVK